MNEYTVIYREKGEKNGQLFETSVTADSVKEARGFAREDLMDCYTILSVKLADPQTV